MKRKKLAGVGLAICVMGAVMTACGAGRQTEDGGASSAERSAAYTDGIAKEPGNDGGNSRTASGNLGTESDFPSELQGDAYLNGPDTCPDVTFVPDGPVTAEGGRFLLSVAEDGDVWRYDEFETLKRYMHGEWYQVPIITGRCGNSSYYDVPVDKPETMDIEWQWLYGELPPRYLLPGKGCFSREGSGRGL